MHERQLAHLRFRLTLLSRIERAVRRINVRNQEVGEPGADAVKRNPEPNRGKGKPGKPGRRF